MPNDDRMPVKAQGSQEDDGLDAKAVRGVEHVIALATRQHFPRGDKRVAKPLVGMPLVMPEHVEALACQLQGAIEEMRGERPLLPLADDSLCVLGMIEIDSHLSVLAVFHLPLSHGTLSMKGTARKHNEKVIIKIMMRSGMLLRKGWSSSMLAYA